MELVELTGKLVGFNTAPGESNLEIIDFLANYCEELGFVVNRFEYLGDKNLKQCNMVATIGGNGQPSLAFSGHTDTVSFENAKWESDPLKLTYRNGEYYGRGVADMKLFLALALKASEAIPVHDFKRPFALYFTAEEEIGCHGAKDLTGFNRKPAIPKIKLARNIIIGEPTTMDPVNKHKGYYFFRVVIKVTTDEHARQRVKKVTHSSDDTKTTNVVGAVLPHVILALDEFQVSLRRFVDEEFKLSYPTMNIGGNIVMPQGSMKNIIPSEVVLECDLRPIPGMQVDDLKYLMKTKLNAVVSKIKPVNLRETIKVDVVSARISTPPMHTPSDSEIVRNVIRAAKRNLAKGVSFNTEGGVYNAAGANAVIWGPASIEQAHQIDEFASERWFSQKVVDQYIELIRHFCVREET